MFNNLYEKIKEFIKENYKTLLFFVVLYLFFMFPVNYYILTGGGIMEVGNRIEVEDAYKSKGSLNLAYVSETRGTIATYLLSFIMKDWERIDVSDYTYDDTEDAQDVNFRGNIDLLNASDNAIKNAYLEAGKTYKVKKSRLYVYYKDKKNKNEFNVGDEVLKVNNQKVNSVDDYRNIISKYSVNDKISVTVKRAKKDKNINVSLYEKNGKIVSGVYISPVNQYTTDPNVKIKFKKSESGPSGGLIETLDIYNKLTKKDITNGLKIAGTGEIDSEGNILKIGGVKYKLLGAVRKKADVFIVPNDENYETCMKLKKKRGLKIKIIGVSTFKEALTELKRL